MRALRAGRRGSGLCAWWRGVAHRLPGTQTVLGPAGLRFRLTSPRLAWGVTWESVDTHSLPDVEGDSMPGRGRCVAERRGRAVCRDGRGCCAIGPQVIRSGAAMDRPATDADGTTPPRVPRDALSLIPRVGARAGDQAGASAGWEPLTSAGGPAQFDVIEDAAAPGARALRVAGGPGIRGHGDQGPQYVTRDTCAVRWWYLCMSRLARAVAPSRRRDGANSRAS